MTEACIDCPATLLCETSILPDSDRHWTYKCHRCGKRFMIIYFFFDATKSVSVYVNDACSKDARDNGVTRCTPCADFLDADIFEPKERT